MCKELETLYKFGIVRIKVYVGDILRLRRKSPFNTQ